MGDLIAFLMVIPVFALISTAFHYWLHNRILAILIPTFAVPFILPLIDYFMLGRIDPFTIDAMLNAAIMMLIISWLVSIPFKKHRENNGKGV
ncbi:hypothetical protein [Aliiglaciecola litoralis]|uniref:Uncharacterized protein n=1 Tax=Aliiglaciecola litoralis TaxID=582857 RepID=A0ABN1LU12_9ALTE